MNIFLLHLNLRKCAQMHVDKHVIKMILESVQLLCSAHHCTNSTYIPPYKLSHKNHPCAVWTRASQTNYTWLCQLAQELCTEYTYRYGKVHKCQQYLPTLTKNAPPIPNLGMTPFAQCMPTEYKDGDAVQAYRAYYFFDKANLHSWKGKVAGRPTPQWVIDTHRMFDRTQRGVPVWHAF